MLISLNRIKKEGATFLRQLRIFKDKSRKGTKKQNEGHNKNKKNTLGQVWGIYSYCVFHVKYLLFIVIRKVTNRLAQNR